MYKSCSKCGKIHDTRFKCNAGTVYQNGEERKLRSKYAWTKKSLEIRERANYLCEVCRDNGVYVYDNLEVHHITKLRENPSGLLDNYNLICLCESCHEKAEKNQIDSDYLKELAKNREDMAGNGSTPEG